MQTLPQTESPTIEKNHSDDITEFAKALCELQGELDNVEKGKDNPFFKTKYADLSACLEAAREPMKKNGFSHNQLPEFDGQMVHVTTMLLHTSGQWMKSRLSLKPVKQDPQAVGSAITYARRYSFCAMIGLTQKDDDGQAGSKVEKIGNLKAEAIRAALPNLVKTNGEAFEMSEIEFCQKTRYESIDAIPLDDWGKVVGWLEQQGADFGPKE